MILRPKNCSVLAAALFLGLISLRIWAGPAVEGLLLSSTRPSYTQVPFRTRALPPGASGPAEEGAMQMGGPMGPGGYGALGPQAGRDEVPHASEAG